MLLELGDVFIWTTQGVLTVFVNKMKGYQFFFVFSTALDRMSCTRLDRERFSSLAFASSFFLRSSVTLKERVLSFFIMLDYSRPKNKRNKEKVSKSKKALDLEFVVWNSK